MLILFLLTRIAFNAIEFPIVAIIWKTPFRCISSVSPQTTSSIRDIIFVVAVFKNTNLAENILSIRSSGCRARILLMVEHNHTFDDALMEVITYTETEILYNDFGVHMKDSQERYLADELRLVWMRDWLNQHRSEVDRCLLADAFDVFYARDPFGTIVNNETLTFFSEDLTLDEDDVNLGWIQQCYGDSGAAAVGAEQIVCSGTVAGPVTEFFSYLDLMLHGNESKIDCVQDQAQLLYMLHTGYFDRHGLKYEIKGCLDVVAMHNCGWKARDISDAKEILNWQGEVPVLVHQYTHLPFLRGNIQKVCNVSEFMFRFNNIY